MIKISLFGTMKKLSQIFINNCVIIGLGVDSMELSEVLWKLFDTLVSNKYFLITATLALLMKLLYPKYRGFMGEFWVKQELKKLPKDKYRVLNDIMVKQNGTTHQIDHLIISQFGIFVIEMKNYYGYIWGNARKDKWLQQLGYNGKYKYYFKNPIHQNYGHVKALEELLNLDNKYFIPIVCFSNQVRLSKDIKDDVVQLDYLVSAIKIYQDSIIEEQSLDTIYNKIVEFNITDKLERKKHVKNIKAKISEDNEKVNNMICPKCGRELIIRNGRYGSFIGCSNYPKCKFTKK